MIDGSRTYDSPRHSERAVQARITLVASLHAKATAVTAMIARKIIGIAIPILHVSEAVPRAPMVPVEIGAVLHRVLGAGVVVGASHSSQVLQSCHPHFFPPPPLIPRAPCPC